VGQGTASVDDSTGKDEGRAQIERTRLSGNAAGCKRMGTPKKVESAHFSPDVLQFIEMLARHEVKYVVVGGEAVIYHGYARLTGDVDFFYSDAEENLKRLFLALNEFWGGSTPGISSKDELGEPGVIIQFGRPPNRIDLLNRIDGVAFDDAWSTRISLEIEVEEKPSVPVFILSREKLIQNKQACGRAKDLDDLKYLTR
jgi:hypothetical protein